MIAQLAREAGALTVGVVTKPFAFEGRARMRRAEQGLQSLTEHVDTLITIPNEKLMALADDDLTFVEAFRKADEVLLPGRQGHQRPHHPERHHQRRFRRRTHGDERHGPRPDGQRLCQGRRPRSPRRGAGHLLAAARRRLCRGRDRRAHQHRRRPRHEDQGDPRGRVAGAGAGTRGRERDLRSQRRRGHGRHARGHCHRDRLPARPSPASRSSSRAARQRRPSRASAAP